MCAGAGSAAIRVDRKHVGGATEGADGHPATVLGETHILDLGREGMEKTTEAHPLRKLSQSHDNVPGGILIF